MSHDHEVIELPKINEPEYMELVIKAFQDSPQVPALMEKPKHTRIVIRNLLNIHLETMARIVMWICICV